MIAKSTEVSVEEKQSVNESLTRCSAPQTLLEDLDDYLPARMINEAVYCHRLFYLMHVEGQFAHNVDTEDGVQKHTRVDQRTDALHTPIRKDVEADETEIDFKPKTADELDSSELAENEPVTIHARSVTLASESLRVVAKLDLIEGTGISVTPVDYKRGSPRRDRDGMPTAWDPERVQICLQALVLRENGFDCKTGVLYFAETRQRVTVPIDEELIELTRASVLQARLISDFSAPPPPLIDSPKCPRCSLSAICLPDETNRCRSADQLGKPPREVRLPTTPRDDLRPLYLNTQGLFVGKSDEVLRIKDQGKIVQDVRMKEVNQVNVFGNIQISTQALQTLAYLDIPVVFHSQNGYFYGALQGSGLKNIMLRREQFRMADDSARCLKVAKALVEGKIRNQRTLLMRNHIAPPDGALRELKRCVEKVANIDNPQSLLGLEGIAARIYFEHFGGMIKVGDAPVDPLAAIGQPPKWTFDFRGRNRRPPRDPVNAMLSLGYSLLSKDLTIACTAVGLDPYLGFFHLPRPGRPAMPLDLMEPFRPLIVDSVVITAINTRMVYPEHFVAAGNGVSMTEPGRKAFFRAYEQRMDQLVTHPLFEYRVSYRRLLEIQTRLLARVISGEINSYPVFVTR